MIFARFILTIFLNLNIFSNNRVNGRAVNINNSWTLPEEGYKVFYRYFRDKITWYEADAVCQFHHANLITVEDGIQFDAARAFLKELDVNENVWIGLSRLEKSNYFSWTNTNILDKVNGYWAESIPSSNNPLCAVIDPVRDFRWHALHCGGPEMASFICQLQVPSWARDCTIRSMPSLTVQYMAETESVRLSRDCGELGSRHISCRGKQDYQMILQELQCNEDEKINTPSMKKKNNGTNKNLRNIKNQNEIYPDLLEKDPKENNSFSYKRKIGESGNLFNIKSKMFEEESVNMLSLPESSTMNNARGKRSTENDVTTSYTTEKMISSSYYSTIANKEEFEIVTLSSSTLVENISEIYTDMGGDTTVTPYDLSTSSEKTQNMSFEFSNKVTPPHLLDYNTSHTPTESEIMKTETTKWSKTEDHFVPPMLLVKSKFHPIYPYTSYSKSTINQKADFTSTETLPSSLINTDITTEASNDMVRSNTRANEKEITVSDNYVNQKMIPSNEQIQGLIISSDNEVQIDADRMKSNDSIDPVNTNYMAENLFSNNDKAINSDADEKVLSSSVFYPLNTHHSENSLSNFENFKPYKRNRRRLLTKSDHSSYLKRILM